ncbi:tetratricopeptide repeat protein [Patescibacteria group bacterium]|nr:tetratricopeptide repeat protein [Patescibacteria group bacterium]
MSVILEALKRVQRARTDKIERDRRFKITTILSPVDVAKKKRLFLSLPLVGIGGGLIFFLVFTVLSPTTALRERARYSGRENLEAPRIVKSDAGSEPRKAPPVMELQKPEPPNNSTREDSFPPNKMVGIPAQQIPQKEFKPEPPQSQPQLKTYVNISPPPKESLEKPDAKKDKPPKQIPIELNPPQSSIYHFNLGVFYQGEGKLREAMEEYEKVLSLAPSHVGAHNNLGVVYKDLGKLDMAIAKYRKAITLDPQYKKAHCNLAAALYLKGDLESASSESRLAIVLDPNDLEGYNILGLIYKKQNKTQEAIEVFRKALAIDPGHPQTHYNLAILLEKLGNIPGAIFHYQKLVDISRARGDNQDLVGKVVRHLEQLSSS